MARMTVVFYYLGAVVSFVEDSIVVDVFVANITLAVAVGIFLHKHQICA
jgi:hypothetical protein